MATIATAQAADEIPITLSANVLVSGTYRAVRDGMVNDDNRLDQNSGEANAAVVLEGNAFDLLRYRVRMPLEAEHRAGDDTDEWTSHADPTVQELASDFTLNDGLTMTVGKTNLQWDPSYSAHPLGFFEKEVDVSDINDLNRMTEGQPMVALSSIGDGWDLTAVMASDIGTERDGYQRGLTQWAVKGGYQWGATNLIGVVQQPLRERIGVGSGFSYATGTNLELHGSAFVREGTRRHIHRDLLGSTSRYYTADDDVVDEYRRKDHQWYPRWVVGGQWTSDSLLNVIVEWSHDSQGLSDDQWSRLQQETDFHRAGGLGIPAAAIDGNLRQDALMFGQQTVRQDYLFVRLLQGGGTWEPSLSTLVNLADGSTSLNARLLYTGAYDWQMWFDGRANLGKPGSEFREVPEAGYLGVTVRYIY